MNSTPKPRRTTGMEALKILMGSGAMAATIGLWSLFANRDFVNQLAQTDASTPTQAADDFLAGLPPIPTLVPYAVGSSVTTSQSVQPTAIDPQNLRTVSAPSQSSGPSSVTAPRVVRGSGGGGGGGGGGTVTTTRSS